MLSQIIFKIHESQMDNERGFSITGIMSKSRSRIGDSTIDDITWIYYNLRESTHLSEHCREISNLDDTIHEEIQQITNEDEGSE